jgi:transposase InsO family protein
MPMASDPASAGPTTAGTAVAESFFATLKSDLVYRRSWPTRAAARSAIFEYIEGFYNPRRLHSALGNLSPVAYEQRPSPVAQSA